jgi:hypothetical protein
MEIPFSMKPAQRIAGKTLTKDRKFQPFFARERDRGQGNLKGSQK